MKLLIVLVSLFFSANTLAQRVTYIIDNTRVAKNGLDSGKVFYIEVMKGEVLKTMMRTVDMDSIVIQYTKEFVTAKYQQNLGLLSKEYKTYIESRQNDDAQVLYALNGGPEQEKSDGLIRKLYLLTKKGNLTKAILVYRSFDLNKPTLLISTKE